MNIGFDAKRAFHNGTGLGVFSRVLIKLLASQYPDNEYYLFNPRQGNLFKANAPNLHEVQPEKQFHKILSSLWRSKWVNSDLAKYNIHIYHGLSHEIPSGIHRTEIPSIVTMHDMFPELYPDQYKPLDVKIYRTKSRYACQHATRIMATSLETKRHIAEHYHLDPGKIDVIYQSCDPRFSVLQTDAEKAAVREKYHLPETYFLHVGTIIERKNLLNICKAMNLIRNEINIPLVVIGHGDEYKAKVKQYIAEAKLENSIIFLSERLEQQGKKPFIATQDFPAIYQSAVAMVYPSFYEGFGIPVVEAISSGVPVITSKTSCLPETGGPASFYVDPASAEEIATGLTRIYGDKEFASWMIRNGREYSLTFAPDMYAKTVMTMYENLLRAVS